VASIGVAGENGVRFATISNEGRHAGRGGLGAVMGAKRLKAVVVRGDRRPPLADPEAVARRARDLARRALGPATAKYREVGTAGNLSAFARVGALPTRNFRGESMPGVDRLDPASLARDRGHGRASCAACNIGCEHFYRLADETRVRVEYESLFALGPLCGIDDPNAVLQASHRCDELGLDTISTGGTIAFAMECRERGYLETAPGFGDAEGMLSLLEDIALRRGGGALLAEGSRRAAGAIGRDSLDFAPQVKGLEIPGYEPRALQTMALGFAVGTRGADHNRSGAYELDFSTDVDRFRGDDRAAARAVEPELRAALMDSMILCKFLRHALDDLFEESAAMLREVVGWDVDAEELRSTTRRIADLKKAFNIREGAPGAHGPHLQPGSRVERRWLPAREHPGRPRPGRLSRHRSCPQTYEGSSSSPVSRIQSDTSVLTLSS
jgi:aldehyde:ferredoxin oxidoreductase